jgi:hypothetical protein
MLIRNNKGQSTIEFILTFTSAVGFIFLFLKMAMNYTNGYMVHHATFMASRAYLVGDSEAAFSPEASDDNAYSELAKKVFDKNLPAGLVQGVSSGQLKYNHPGQFLPVFTGVWVEFSQIFSLGFIGGKDPVMFRSESFLGREPTRGEVVTQVCNAISSVSSLGNCNILATLDDNGA